MQFRPCGTKLSFDTDSFPYADTGTWQSSGDIEHLASQKSHEEFPSTVITGG